MDTFTATEYFVENVKPVVSSATLIAPNQIKVVLSKAVDVTTVSAEDFDVYVGTTQESEAAGFTVTGVAAGSPATDNQFIITLVDGLSAAEYAQTLTLKVVAGATDVIADTKGNLVTTGDVVISK
ncbi:hypothetical protein [Gottfriedia solisilvae]|uniref:hypothetical protein n=1 Tax=Gottfriedia solisilvae TaxID=1516104 RepID=UPI003D2EF4F3